MRACDYAATLGSLSLRFVVISLQKVGSFVEVISLKSIKKRKDHSVICFCCICALKRLTSQKKQLILLTYFLL